MFHSFRTYLLQEIFKCSPFNIKGDLSTPPSAVQKGVISCLIPSFRRENLASLLEDLHAQDIDPAKIEIIVVDAEKEDDRRIGFLRNLSIARSCGELLLFLDDDTRIFQRDFLSKALSIFNNEGFDILAPKGHAHYCYLTPQSGFLKPFSFATRCCFIKRSAVLEVGGFRNIHAFEDTEMRIRIQTKTRKIMLSSELEYYHPPSDLACPQKPYALAHAVISLKDSYPFYFWLLIYLNQFFLILEKHRQREVFWLIAGLFRKKKPIYCSPAKKERKRIILIGPAFPIRGGIAHHTSSLYKALLKRHPTLLISFKKLYPHWLYPGQDYIDQTHQQDHDPNILRTLSSLNPISWIKTLHLIKKERPQHIIIAWWTVFLFPVYYFLIIFAKNSKTRITIICHNALPHEATPFSKYLTQLVLSQADKIIVHAKSEKDLLSSFMKHPCITLGFMPPDTYHNQTTITPQEARQRLNLQGKVLLFFGLIRPYKGLHVLLKAMPLVLKQENITLVIAGECWEKIDTYKDLIDQLGIGHAVRLIDRYITQEELPLFFLSADALVLPYTSSSGSSVLEIAQGFNLPVVATRKGNFPEMVKDGENGFLVEAGNEDELAQSIIKSLKPAFKERTHLSLAQTKKDFSWDKLTQLLLS